MNDIFSSWNGYISPPGGPNETVFFYELERVWIIWDIVCHCSHTMKYSVGLTWWMAVTQGPYDKEKHIKNMVFQKK